MIKELALYVLFAVTITRAGSFSPPKYSDCSKKDFGHGSFVCVCNEDSCDHFDEKGSSPLKPGQFAVYTSSKDGQRFDLKFGMFNKTWRSHSENVMNLTVDDKVTYQSILGFGGAFTGRYLLAFSILTLLIHSSLVSIIYYGF